MMKLEKIKKYASIGVMIAIVILPLSAKAQTKPAIEEKTIPGKAYFGLGFQTAFPQGDFKLQNDHNGYGISLDLAYGLEEVPLIFGIDGAYLVYGSKTQKTPLSPTIPGVYVDVTQTYSLSFGHVFFRLQPQQGFARPYADAFFGFNYLSTNTEVSSENNYDGENHGIASSTNLDDFALSYGAGAGVMVNLYDFHTDQGNKSSIMLDLNAKYVFGGEAEYLPSGGLTVVDGKLNYNIKKSKTDFLAVKIGVVFTID